MPLVFLNYQNINPKSNFSFSM